MSGYKLTWEPVVDSGVEIDCEGQLGRILEKKYGEYPFHLSEDDIDYIQGLGDAGVKGARTISGALGQYNVIKIDKSY